jgi:hypothetical protein
METRPNPVDARVGGFVSLCPSFFFLFNNLKKKKKRAARTGQRGLQTEFVEKTGLFVEFHGMAMERFPSKINNLGEKCTALHGFSVLCVSCHGGKRMAAAGPSTAAWPGLQRAPDPTGAKSHQDYINLQYELT